MVLWFLPPLCVIVCREDRDRDLSASAIRPEVGEGCPEALTIIHTEETGDNMDWGTKVRQEFGFHGHL